MWNRLSKEIRDNFDNIEDINGQTTAKLSYLDAVIHESTSPVLKLLTRDLRIRPVAANGQPRVAPPEGMTIAGRFIKGNVPFHPISNPFDNRPS